MQTNIIPTTKRSHRGTEQWKTLVTRFEETDLTIKDFCPKENISRGTFSRWRRKLLLDSNETLPGFIEIPTAPPLSPSTEPWSVELDLPSGGQLQIRFGL